MSELASTNVVVLQPASAAAARGGSADAAGVRRWVFEADASGACGPLRRCDAGSLAGSTLVLLDGLAGADLLTLLEAVDDAFGDAPATLWLVEDFALCRTPESPPGHPLLQHTLDILLRMGWSLAADTTVEDEAARIATTWRADRQGAGGYRRLRLVRSNRPAMRLVRVDDGKSVAMRALFEQVFGHAMSAEHWQWKYGDGRGRSVGAMKDGQLVAHYGGVQRRVLFHGRPALACQVGDVMVLPSANRSLARAGPMQQVGATFAVLEVGFGMPHLVGFGFPNTRAFGVAQRLGLYQAVDEVVQVSWPAADAQMTSDLRVEAVQGPRLLPDQRRAVDRLWAGMAGAFKGSIVGVRDADWIEHRYLQRPGVTYTVLLLRSRWLRRLSGLLVLRQQGDALNLLDLVCDPAQVPSVVRMARVQARHLGAQRLDAWITRSHLARLAQADADLQTVQSMGIVVPSTLQTDGPPADALQQRWFLLCGDADFT